MNKVVISTFIGAALGAVAVSFVMWSVQPATWSATDRVGLVIMMFLGGVVGAAIGSLQR